MIHPFRTQTDAVAFAHTVERRVDEGVPLREAWSHALRAHGLTRSRTNPLTPGAGVMLGLVGGAILGGVFVYFATKPAAAPAPGTILPPGAAAAAPPTVITLLPNTPAMPMPALAAGATVSVQLPADGSTWASTGSASSLSGTPVLPNGGSAPLQWVYAGTSGILTLVWTDGSGNSQTSSLSFGTPAPAPAPPPPPATPLSIALQPGTPGTQSQTVALGTTVLVSLPAGAQWGTSSASTVPGVILPAVGSALPITWTYSGPGTATFNWTASGNNQTNSVTFVTAP